MGEAYEKSKLWLIAKEPSSHFLDFSFHSLPVRVLPIYSSLECDATSRQLLQLPGFKSAILALTPMPVAQSAALGGQTWLLPGGTAQAKLDLLQKSLPIFLSWRWGMGSVFSWHHSGSGNARFGMNSGRAMSGVVCSINAGFSAFSKSPFHSTLFS